MAPWLACVQEHRRTYEGCRDLHQTQLVLAAVSGGGRGLREREPPSFGSMQADLRTYFEMPEDGQEPRGNHASEAFPCCIAKCRCALQHRALQGWSQEPSRQFSALGGVSCRRVSTPLAATKRVFGVMQYGAPPTTDARSEIGPVGSWVLPLIRPLISRSLRTSRDSPLPPH